MIHNHDLVIMGAVVMVVITAYVVGYLNGASSRRMNTNLRIARDREWETMLKFGREYNLKPKRGEGITTFKQRVANTVCSREEGCVGMHSYSDQN